MTELGLFLQIAIVAYLVLAEPFYGKRLFTQLVSSAGTDPRARSRFYWRTLRLEWGVAALALLSLWMRRQPLETVGLRAAVFTDPAVGGAVVGGVAGLVFSIVLAGLSPRVRDSMGKQLAPLQAMLPATTAERWQFGAVSITAGICEELLFRGFLGMTFSELFPQAPIWITVTVLAVVFGLAHWYQGWRGVGMTALLGAGLALLYLVTQSLWPGMLLHALIDLRLLGLVLVAGRRRVPEAAA